MTAALSYAAHADVNAAGRSELQFSTDASVTLVQTFSADGRAARILLKVVETSQYKANVAPNASFDRRFPIGSRPRKVHH